MLSARHIADIAARLGAFSSIALADTTLPPH